VIRVTNKWDVRRISGGARRFAGMHGHVADPSHIAGTSALGLPVSKRPAGPSGRVLGAAA